MVRRRWAGLVLACGALALVGCKRDIECGPLELSPDGRVCICPNGGRHEDGLCYLDDGAVTPLDAGTIESDAGLEPDDAGPEPSDAGPLDACVPRGDEVCDGVLDEDCDGTVDEGCECTNGAERPCGTSDVGACRRGTQRCVDGAWAACEGAIEPSAETCNDVDDDCDGSVDEELPQQTYYRDADGDTYGTEADTRVACRRPSGYVDRAGDCNDANATVHPGQTAFFEVPIEGAPAGRRFDYDCNGEEEMQYRAAVSPTCGYVPALGGLGRHCSVGAVGFVISVLDIGTPACGQSGFYRTSCALTAPETCTSTGETRVQSCR